ncbi:hypothetical protein X801_00914, partial [Opisthorchis viverrini]
MCCETKVESRTVEGGRCVTRTCPGLYCRGVDACLKFGAQAMVLGGDIDRRKYVSILLRKEVQKRTTIDMTICVYSTMRA